jgi:hypothetical protein
MRVLPPTQLIRVGQAGKNKSFKSAHFGSGVDNVSVLLGFIFPAENSDALTRCRNFLLLRGIGERLPEISDAEDDRCTLESSAE